MKLRYICFLFLILALAVFLSLAVSAAGKPENAVKFVISNPGDGTVGTPITVTVEAQKSNNQIDTAYQNNVTLDASGSVTGEGVVDIVNGIGTIEINDGVAETVTLSLSNPEDAYMDITSTQEVTFVAGGDGTLSWHQQKFWFRDDDGSEVSATGYGSEDTAVGASIINVMQGANLRLRFGVKLSVADSSNLSPRLEFKEGGGCDTGNWTVVTSSTGLFHLVSSPYFNDKASTTQQIISGSNFIAGQILESTNPAPALNMLKNQFTEYEWSLATSLDVPFSITYSFRVTNNGEAFVHYTQCPSLTIKSSPTYSVRPTTVTFSGTAFPGAKILVVDKDVRFEKIVSQDLIADEKGEFNVGFVGIVQGQHSFGLLVKDGESRTTQTKFFNVDTISNDLVVKNVLVPPTVGFLQRVVSRGQSAVVVGNASPGNSIILEIDDKIKKEAKIGEDGSYKAAIDTGELEFGIHRVRVKQVGAGQNQESDYSPTSAFTVSRLAMPKTDLSGDGAVDIKDWSIFLSNWGFKDESKRKLIDFNDDGKINISDFSIFIRAIKK